MILIVFQIMDFVVEDALTREGVLTAGSPVGVRTLSEVKAEITFVGPALRLLVLSKKNHGDEKRHCSK